MFRSGVQTGQIDAKLALFAVAIPVEHLKQMRLFVQLKTAANPLQFACLHKQLAEFAMIDSGIELLVIIWRELAVDVQHRVFSDIFMFALQYVVNQTAFRIKHNRLPRVDMKTTLFSRRVLSGNHQNNDIA